MADQHDESVPATKTPAARPQPAFGEYAPEGWEWKPEGSDSADPASQQAAPDAPPPGDSGRVSGVPHNLGSGSHQPATTPRTARTSGSTSHDEPAPYRAAVAPPAPSSSVAQAGQPGSPKPRTGDRVVTIVLLVIGALGALLSAQSMLGLRSSFSLMADAVGIADFEVPAWLGTLGTVSALGCFAIYAVALIFSIQRMRARKLTFWVPLTAGVVVFIAIIIITTVAITSMPELMSQLSDPDATQKMLDYLSTTP